MAIDKIITSPDVINTFDEPTVIRLKEILDEHMRALEDLISRVKTLEEA
jgi:hypothetical protein